MRYIRKEMQSLRSMQRNDYNASKINKQAADIDYIAMMCDVELEQDGVEDIGDDSEEV